MSIRDRMRQRLNDKKDERDFEPHFVEQGKDPDEVPILVAEPAQPFVERLGKRLEASEINQRRYVTLLLIHCCYAPAVQEGANEPIIDEGEYVLGERIWEDADIDELEAEHHTVGGWLERLKKHVQVVYSAAVKKKNAYVTRPLPPPDDASSTESPSDTDSPPGS